MLRVHRARVYGLLNGNFENGIGPLKCLVYIVVNVDSSETRLEKTVSETSKENTPSSFSDSNYKYKLHDPES